MRNFQLFQMLEALENEILKTNNGIADIKEKFLATQLELQGIFMLE